MRLLNRAIRVGVSQLSHHLLSHLSWRVATETLVIFLAIFWVWFSTGGSATIFPVEEPRMRRLIFIVMLLGLFMDTLVTRAFTTSAWAFIFPFLLNIRSQLHWIGGLQCCWLATLALSAYAALILVGMSLTALAILHQKILLDRSLKLFLLDPLTLSPRTI